MAGQPGTGPLLQLAEQAERLSYDSLWVGDSLLARPRHDPLTLLAAVAARTSRAALGTAVLLPALRNPVVLAHQLATLDQLSEGRLILGAGIAADTPAVRAEFAAAGVPFEGRLGRTLEGLRLCRALWTGEPVRWTGRWELENAVLGPVPFRPGGPPVWMGTSAPAGLARTGRRYDGWFPLGPDPETYRQRRAVVLDSALSAGRAPSDLTFAAYLTISLDDDVARAESQLNEYLERYYSAPAAALRRVQACYAGPPGGLVDWIRSWLEAGAEHIVLRFAGAHERNLEVVARLRADAGW